MTLRLTISLRRTLRHLGLLVAAGLLASCAGSLPPAPSSAALAELAPGGKLRAAINLGNPILAARAAASG